MISSNAVASPYRARQTKAAYAQIQRDVERYALDTWPELRCTPIYTRDRGHERETPRVTRNEGAAVWRTGEPSYKQALAGKVAHHLEIADTVEALKASLRADGLEFYQRGQSWGVVDRASGKRHRIRTLGLEAMFERLRRGERVPRTTAQPHNQSTPPVIVPGKHRAARTAELQSRRAELKAAARKELDGFERDQELER